MLPSQQAQVRLVKRVFYQSDHDGRFFYPTIRVLHARMQLIHVEEETWTERILIEERGDQKIAEHLNHMQVQLAENNFSLLPGGQTSGLPMGHVRKSNI